MAAGLAIIIQSCVVEVKGVSGTSGIFDGQGAARAAELVCELVCEELVALMSI
jgi:hypothetical protein